MTANLSLSKSFSFIKCFHEAGTINHSVAGSIGRLQYGGNRLGSESVDHLRQPVCGYESDLDAGDIMNDQGDQISDDYQYHRR